MKTGRTTPSVTPARGTFYGDKAIKIVARAVIELAIDDLLNRHVRMMLRLDAWRFFFGNSPGMDETRQWMFDCAELNEDDCRRGLRTKLVGELPMPKTGKEIEKLLRAVSGRMRWTEKHAAETPPPQATVQCLTQRIR